MTLSGYVDTSAIWKFGTGNGRLPGRAFDGVGKLDGFNLNVLNFVLDQPLDEARWSAGYHVSLLFDPDAIGCNNSIGSAWYFSALAGKKPGERNKLLSCTGTIDYALWANVVSRAEVRWDHATDGSKPFGVADRNAVTLAANIVYKF